MKIIVGSKNAAKVKAVQDGARAYWPEVVVEGHDVDSGVSAQPLSNEETMRGALNRAHAAKALGADLGIGLEAGVVDVSGQPVMMGYVGITDGVREVVVPSVGTPLPQSWGEAMKNGGELRPYVVAAGLPYDYTKGVLGLLTNDRVLRDEGFGMAVKCGLVPWVNPAAFKEEPAAA